jgi:AraC-like DNA-binding protein
MYVYYVVRQQHYVSCCWTIRCICHGELRNSFGDDERARTIEWAASLVERALREQADERLTLAEASARSGYSQDHLARLIREGRLPNKWLHVAERKAKLPNLEGGLWHPYRRKWATERKHHSLKDVAAAGGWKDTETLLTCYQQPDADTLLAVMSEPKKMRDAAQTAPPVIEAQSTAGAIANGASR